MSNLPQAFKIFVKFFKFILSSQNTLQIMKVLTELKFV